MMNKKVVIALGGNALGNNPQEQLELVKNTAKSIVEMIVQGYQVVVSHGNGPQVGQIHIKTEYPFPESGAMSQGYIGYHLQQAIKNELLNRGIEKEVVSLVTQVLVDKEDEAFRNPTKPVGAFYTEEEIKKTGYEYIEDSGRGYRRVVASPKPIKILEIDSIKKMVESGAVVIACGGGGIPVIKTENGYEGIAAVIDKDRTTSKLAIDLEAENLFILTAVDRVCINFNKPNQKEIAEMTVEETLQYIKEEHFAKGSMLPKVEAALEFLDKVDGKALITSLENASRALTGETGTIIKR